MKPQLVAHYRPYDITTHKHADWPRGVWKDNTVGDIKFGIIDFRFTLVVLNKRNSKPMMSYFYATMSSFKKKKQLLLEDVPAWLFICSDMVEHVQIQNFVQSHEGLNDYQIDYAYYWPTKHERMGDYFSSKSKTIEKVYLTFP